jgi:hypothetical protein
VVVSLLAARCGSDGSLPAEPTEADRSLIFACIRSTACGVKSYPRVSNCLSGYGVEGPAPALDPIMLCANRARSCTELERCYGPLQECDASFKATCTDGRAIYCDLIDRRTFAYDCASLSMVCAVDPQYAHAATCTGSPHPQPGQQTLSSRLTCAEDQCIPTGQPCSSDEFDRCSGAELQSCLAGQWVTFYCDRLGLGPCKEISTGSSRYARCSAQ